MSSQKIDELIQNAALISSKGRIVLTEGRYSTYDQTKFCRCIMKGGAQEFSAVIFGEEAGNINERGYSRVNLMTGIGVIPGIGIEDLSTAGNSTVDSLDDRCARYSLAGFRFATRMTQLNIGLNGQSEGELNTTAIKLTQFAKVCQQNNLVPVLEIKVVGAYGMEMIETLTQKFLTACFESFQNNGVHIQAIMLKLNMVRQTNAPESVSPDTVAQRTISSLLQTVPPEVPALIFPGDDYGELAKCAELSTKKLPWKLVSFLTFEEFLTATGDRYIWNKKTQKKIKKYRY